MESLYKEVLLLFYGWVGFWQRLSLWIVEGFARKDDIFTRSWKMTVGYLGPIPLVKEPINIKELKARPDPLKTLSDVLAINTWLVGRQKNINKKLEIADEYVGLGDLDELSVINAVVSNLLQQPIYTKQLTKMEIDMGAPEGLHQKNPEAIQNFSMQDFKTLYGQFRDVTTYISTFLNARADDTPKKDKINEIKALWEAGQTNGFLFQLDAVMTIGALIDFFQREYNVTIQPSMKVSEFFESLKVEAATGKIDYMKKYSSAIKIGLLCTSVFALGFLFVDRNKS